MPRKYVKKTYKKSAKKAIKSRPLAKKVAKLSKQVALMKPEKKLLTGQITNYIGQVSGNDAAYLALDMTPSPLQGTSENTRTGSQITATGFFSQIQITPMSANVCSGLVQIELWKINGFPSLNAYTFVTSPAGLASNPAELIYNSNLFINNSVKPIIDVNSLRNMDFNKDFTLIRRKSVYFPERSDTTVSTRAKTIKFSAKFKDGHLISFNKNTSTITNGTYFILFKTNIGNVSTTTASTLNNIPLTAINTGFTMSMNFTNFYTDI